MGFAKLFNIFKPKDPKIDEEGKIGGDTPPPLPHISQPNGITNQQLLDQLLDHFTQALLTESVGSKMLYPMSYNVLMHADDYNSRIQALPFVLPEVVSSFYRRINEMRAKFPNFNPPARYWFFQFTGCNIDNIPQGENVLNIQKGRLTTIAQLLTADDSDVSGTSIEANVNVSIKIEGSDVMKGTNIDTEALKSLDMVSDNIFKFKFDHTLDGDTERIRAYSNMELAELSYTDGSFNYKFTMKDNLIHVSGNNEMRNTQDIFKVKNDHLINSHVQIKHDPFDQKFYIAAYGPTNVNGKALELSQGGDLKWHPLAHNSSIFFPQAMIGITFKIK